MPHLIPLLITEGEQPELVAVIDSLLIAAKEIATRVNQGALAGVLGSTTDENVHGEKQTQLDVLANTILKNELLQNEHVRTIASEEENGVIEGSREGRYVVAFDPLDGSSNIDINGQIGTIFTIFPARDDVASDSAHQFCQSGKQQVCAGYVLYAGSILAVICTHGPTRCFTHDRHTDAFRLTAHPKIPQDTQEFAINMANQRFWIQPMRDYINDLMAGETGPRAKRFNMRWNAAMVGDIHRILIRGGIFSYPSDNRDALQPNKLRLLYEAFPMALLLERAGGKAVSEQQRILDIQPTELHQRVSVIMGSANEVDACLSYFEGSV
jgi:fructose-1,6-bisphosphatase I